MTKKTIDIPIPLSLAIAHKHVQDAERHTQIMRKAFAEAATEALEKQQVTMADLGALAAYGCERRPEGYVIVSPVYDEEE